MEIKLEKIDHTQDDGANFIIDNIIKYFPKYPFPPEINELKLSYQHTYFKALHNNEIIGMTGYIKRTPFLAETTKTIIFEEFRGQGLANFLSQKIEEKCLEKGFHKVMSSIYDYNYKMIQIKLKQGYVIEGYHRHHERPDFHEYTLGKIIKINK